ncbi:MAG: flavin-binding protein [Novosphingobium sp.]
MDLSLDGFLSDAAERLVKAVKDRRQAMHTPVVGTAEGDLRIMVLREVTPQLTLRFHTDLRSPKCALIGGGAPVSVLAYDPDVRIQLRMRGEGRIETAGPIANAAWDRATASSRRCYLAETGPGGVLEVAGSAIPDHLLHRAPTIEETATGRANFAVLLVEVRSLDWLHLTHEGGTRARFTRASASAPWQATWLAP